MGSIINRVPRFAVAAAVLALSLSNRAGEPLVRGDFEFDGMTGILGWSRPYIANGEGVVDTLGEVGPGGKNSVRVAGKADRIAFFTDDMTLVAGEPYRLSALVRTKGLKPGKARMIVTDKRWKKFAEVEIPADTAGRWVPVEGVQKAPKASKPTYVFGFEVFEPSEDAYLDICAPSLEPASEKAKAGSSAPGSAVPLVGRIVPVEPLLSEVDADTGRIRFLANMNTNGCKIVATVDGRPLGPVPEGRHEVNVKLVEKQTGKVRCENTYPFIAKKRKPQPQVGRKLNNFVTEVLNTELKDGEYSFTNPRRGYVFIGFDQPYEKAKAYLSGVMEPVVTFRRGEPSETIRHLQPGEYRLKVTGAAGGRLRVHLVKALCVNGDPIGAPGENVLSSETRNLDWEFFRKAILPSCGQVLLAVDSAHHWPEHAKARIYPELRARGKVIEARTGCGPTRHEQLADRKFIYSRLRGHRLYQEGYPLVWDEFGLHASAKDLNASGEEMWELANELRPHGISAAFFGIAGRKLKDYSPVLALIAGIINSGRGSGMLESESYLKAMPDIASLDEQIDGIITNMQSLSAMMPEAGRRIIHLLNGYERVGVWTSHISPAVDEKVLLDHWLHRMATEPAFADVAGLSTTNPYCGEEILRWQARLMHHYGVLGRTDSLAEAMGWKYNPDTVKDGDFGEGFKHWKVSEAEKGSVTSMVRKGFAKDIQKRVNADICDGDHFALLARSAKGPNKVSQKIGNLKVGEWYIFEFASSDYANVLAPRTTKDTEPQLWAEVKGMPFDARYSSFALGPRGANNWSLPTKACPVRTHRYVFRATAKEAEVTISDWKSDTEMGGPIGRRATLNYISVNPYYLPSGDELEHRGDYDVTAFGAKGDGKTLDTVAIQAALDACAKTGGAVRVPKGTYLTGTLVIGSDTTLFLDRDAVLLGSPNLSDYGADDIYPGSYGSVKEGWSAKHLIVAHNARNTAIAGFGTIDGNGAAFMGENVGPGHFGWRKGHRYGKGRKADCNRPGQQIVFAGCENVRVEGVTLRNMNCWTCFIHGCVDVVVRNVKVRNDQTYANTDGFDIDSSRNVTVTGCDIETGDDAFAIRGDNGKNLYDGAPSRICENIVISGCVCTVQACGVRVGVGGGVIKNVSVKDVDIKSAGTGIFVMNCYGAGPQRGVDISDIRFSDIRIRDAALAIAVSANGLHSKAKLENISFERIDAEAFSPMLVFGSGETKPDNISFRKVRFRMTPLPPNLSYPRPKPVIVERAGRVTFKDCELIGIAEPDPSVAVERELARRAVNPPRSVVKDFKPLTIEASEEQALKETFVAKNYPANITAGKRYRVSYFVTGYNIRPLLDSGNASSVAWANEEEGKVLGITGYHMVGTFKKTLQAYEFDVPNPLPENFKPEIALRLFRASGKAVFEDLVVEEIETKDAAPVPAADSCNDDRIEYVAHQGEEFLAPGHSDAAYRYAVEDGLDYIKMDIRETKDGEIVLQHDRDLKALFGCDWKIESHTLAEIRQNCRYRAVNGRGPHYNEYTNLTIQTLREGLRWGAKTKRGIWLDFKDYSPALVEKTLAIATEAGVSHERMMAATWSRPALEYIRDHHPDIRRVAHTYVRPKEQGYATNLARGMEFSNEDELLAAILAAKERLRLYGLNMPSLVKRAGRVIYDTPPGFVRRLQANGLWVSMWFVNRADIGARCRAEGANAFVTNCKANTK